MATAWILSFGISIHALREEGDVRLSDAGLRDAISIHALREEGDSGLTTIASFAVNFYPRPPRGGRQAEVFTPTWVCKFLSTPSARRATPESVTVQFTLKISIHALREEGDRCARCSGRVHQDFYPRPPRGGRLPPQCCLLLLFSYFYPRPPRGGRLPPQCCLLLLFSYFYPRPPRGGRR